MARCELAGKMITSSLMGGGGVVDRGSGGRDCVMGGERDEM